MGGLSRGLQAVSVPLRLPLEGRQGSFPGVLGSQGKQKPSRADSQHRDNPSSSTFRFQLRLELSLLIARELLLGLDLLMKIGKI